MSYAYIKSIRSALKNILYTLIFILSGCGIDPVETNSNYSSEYIEVDGERILIENRDYISIEDQPEAAKKTEINTILNIQYFGPSIGKIEWYIDDELIASNEQNIVHMFDKGGNIKIKAVPQDSEELVFYISVYDPNETPEYENDPPSEPFLGNSPPIDLPTEEDEQDEYSGDADNDGILDHEDECPNQRGSRKFRGCPDSDGDGIPDHRDDCPYERGPKTNKGCPSAQAIVPKEEPIKQAPPSEYLKKGVAAALKGKCENNAPIFKSTGIELTPTKDLELSQISVYLFENTKVFISISGPNITVKEFSRKLNKDTESKISFEGKDIILLAGQTYSIQIRTEADSAGFEDLGCHQTDGSTSDLAVSYPDGKKAIFNIRYKY